MKSRTSLGVVALLVACFLLVWAGSYVLQSYDGTAAPAASQESFGVVAQEHVRCGSALLVFATRLSTMERAGRVLSEPVSGCMPEAHHRVYWAGGVAIAALVLAILAVLALFGAKRGVRRAPESSVRHTVATSGST